MLSDYRICRDIDEMDLVEVYRNISQSYWASGIPHETFVRALSGSLCFGVISKIDGGQVGFARVISDLATFAYLADVYIHPNHQGQGLGKLLVSTIFQTDELQGLRRWMLATKDAHGLYRQYGFSDLSQPEIYMEIVKPDIYKLSS